MQSTSSIDKLRCLLTRCEASQLPAVGVDVLEALTVLISTVAAYAP